MKKRIVSIILVLAFALLALPMSVSAATGGKISEWTGKVGSISAINNGVFRVDAYDETTNPWNHAHLATWNGGLPEGTIEVTLDLAGIIKGRSNGVLQEGTNDTGIIFGGEGVKDFVTYEGTTNQMNGNATKGMEYTSKHYFLYFCIKGSTGEGSVSISDVNGGFGSGPLGTWKASTSDFADVWANAKNAGKITVKIFFTKTGTLRVYLDETLIPKLSKDNAVPYGSDIGIRTGMGYGYNVDILKAKFRPIGDDNIADWTAKVGGISAIDNGVFQINAYDQNSAATQVNQKGARQAMWNGSIDEGKISITLDTASILAKRSPLATNPGGGSNDTGIIFGGNGIKASTKTTVNNIEAETQYYTLMFTNDTLSINLVDKNNYVMKDNDNDPTTGEDGKEASVHTPWVGKIRDKADDSLLSVSLASSYADLWNAATAAGKVKVTVEWTKAGAVKVWVDDTHITQLDGAAGTAVPFGTEVGIRAGMGYHVPTKVLAIDFGIADIPDTGDNTNVWIFTAAAAVIVLGAVMVVSKKRSVA